MGEEHAKEMILYIDGHPIRAVGNMPEISEIATADLPAAAFGGLAGAGVYATFAISATTEAWVRCMNAIWEAWRRLVEAVAPPIIEIMEWLIDLQHAEATFNEAMDAAKTERPKWVGIYRRTKKARTRKKYKKRILAWYLEEGNQ